MTDNPDYNDILNGDSGAKVTNQLADVINKAPRQGKPFNQNREYGMLPSDLWTGKCVPEFPGLTAAGKILALYLLSSPHATMLGLYRLPIAYIAADIGLPIEEAERTLTELEDAGLVSYDTNTQHVFVKYFVRTQVLTDGKGLHPNDKRAIHARRVFDALPDVQLRADLLALHGAALGLEQ